MTGMLFLGVTIEVAPELRIAQVPFIVFLNDWHDILHFFQEWSPLIDEKVHLFVTIVAFNDLGIKLVHKTLQNR